MRIGSVILVVWLVIGAIAAYQRDYFSSEPTNCAEITTVLLTVERYLPARRPRWSLPLGPARPEHVALSGGPRLERDLSW